MRIIALEEHFSDPEVLRASAPAATRLSPDFAASFDASPGAVGRGVGTASPASLADLGADRLSDMDTHGISMQVLSCLSTQLVPAQVAVEVVRGANDRSAAAVRANPDRFAAGLPRCWPRSKNLRYRCTCTLLRLPG